MGACGWEPRHQAELLFPAQEPPCQLDTGGWARAGLPARHTHRASFEEVAAVSPEPPLLPVALPAPSNYALPSTGLGKLRCTFGNLHSRGKVGATLLSWSRKRHWLIDLRIGPWALWQASVSPFLAHLVPLLLLVATVREPLGER